MAGISACHEIWSAIFLMNSFLTLKVRPWGFIGAAGFLAGLATVAGFLGRFAWWLDLASHFRVQYFLFFVVMAVCCGLGGKRRWALGAVALAVVNAAPVCAFLFPRVPWAADGTHGTAYRAMLINVNTEHGDPARVMEAVRRENPDILVLEEISDDWVKALDPVMKQYPFKQIETRDDNFGIGLLSRIPLVDAAVKHIGRADVPSVFAAISVDGRKLLLIATHPVPPAGAEYSANRNDQLEQLATLAASEGKMNEPVILLGDLNVTPWSYHYGKFMHTSGLTDSAAGRTIAPTWPAFLPWLGIPLDHCFHSTEVLILARKVGDSDGSDHCPLIVSFALKK